MHKAKFATPHYVRAVAHSYGCVYLHGEQLCPLEELRVLHGQLQRGGVPV